MISRTVPNTYWANFELKKKKEEIVLTENLGRRLRDSYETNFLIKFKVNVQIFMIETLCILYLLPFFIMYKK